MADFTRIFPSSGSTMPQFPPGLDSWSVSGKPHFRATMQVGRTWSEVIKPMKWDNPNTQKFVAYINSLWRERTIFTIAHPHLSVLLGDATGGTPLLKGASLSGSSITTDGWQNNTTVLLAGDIIKIEGINLVYDITADALSDGSGNATLSISPPLYPPANFLSDNKAITYNSTDGNVKFRATLNAKPLFPKCGVDAWYIGTELFFRECP